MLCDLVQCWAEEENKKKETFYLDTIFSVIFLFKSSDYGHAGHAALKGLLKKVYPKTYFYKSGTFSVSLFCWTIH